MIREKKVPTVYLAVPIVVVILVVVHYTITKHTHRQTDNKKFHFFFGRLSIILSECVCVFARVKLEFIEFKNDDDVKYISIYENCVYHHHEDDRSIDLILLLLSDIHSQKKNKKKLTSSIRILSI